MKSEHIGRQLGDNDAVPGVAAQPALDTMLSAYGNKRTPVAQQHIEQLIREQLSLPTHAKPPGFTSYDEVFRQEALRRIFVRDGGT